MNLLKKSGIYASLLGLVACSSITEMETTKTGYSTNSFGIGLLKDVSYTRYTNGSRIARITSGLNRKKAVIRDTNGDGRAEMIEFYSKNQHIRLIRELDYMGNSEDFERCDVLLGYLMKRYQ